MGRLQELIERKAKADALPPDVREKYGAVYAAVNDELTGKLIDLAMACEDYTKLFIADPDNLNALIAAARTISETTK